MTTARDRALMRWLGIERTNTVFDFTDPQAADWLLAHLKTQGICYTIGGESRTRHSGDLHSLHWEQWADVGGWHGQADTWTDALANAVWKMVQGGPN